MIAITASMLADMGSSLEHSNREDKQAFAQTRFSDIVFDLDTHRITGFALKGWAEQFLPSRAVYDDPAMCLEGYQPTPLLTVEEAVHFILWLLYGDSPAELQSQEKRERNAEIYRLSLAGEDSVVLGRAFNLSDRRIRDILEHERKRGGQ